MQRAPAIVALLLFVALCASLAYWLLQWLAPEPRTVAAPPEAARPLPSVSAAATLFGGRPQAAGGAQVQLRGILLAGRASVAIIAAEGRPVRALPVASEVLPGLTVKEIGARAIVLSERGAERELRLPAFAAQEGGSAVMQASTAPEAAPPSGPPQVQPPSPSSSSAQAPPQAPSPASAGMSDSGRGAAGDASPTGATPALPQPPGAAPPAMPRRSPPVAPALR